MNRMRLELVREVAGAPYGEQILKPDDAAHVAMRVLADEAQEVVLAFYLDRRHRVRGYSEVARGGLNLANVDMRVLLGGALVSGMPALLVAHNHPSGDATGSPDDHALTQRIERACELVGIEFVDHIIIGHGNYISLRESGLL